MVAEAQVVQEEQAVVVRAQTTTRTVLLVQQTREVVEVAQEPLEDLVLTMEEQVVLVLSSFVSQLLESLISNQEDQ